MLIDWMTVKAEFVEGVVDEEGVRWWPSFGELAQRHEVSSGTVSRKAREGGWPDERRDFQRSVEVERRRRRVELLSAEAADVDVRAMRAASLGMDSVIELLETAKKDLSMGVQVEPRELDALARAARQYHELADKVVGGQDDGLLVEAAGGVGFADALSVDDGERVEALMDVLSRTGLLELPDGG